MENIMNSEEVIKLTDWAKEPSLTELKSDLQQATTSQQAQMTKIDTWNSLLAAKNKPKKVAGRSNVQPKLIRRQAEWRYPALTEPFLNSHKLFKVSPVTFEDADAARQNELVLNYQFRNKINRVTLIDNFVRSTVDDGTSIVRVGWSRKTKMVEQPAPEFTYFEATTEQQFTELQQALDLKGANPREYEAVVSEELKAAVDYYIETDVATVAKITGQTTVKVQKVIENKPTAEVLDPRNVFIDPACNGDFSKAMFVITSRETNKAELMKDAHKYQNLDKIDWDNVSIFAEANHVTSTPDGFTFKDAARKRVVVYEYWGYYDINGTDELTPILASWIGDTIINLSESPFSDGKLPFVVTNYLPVKRELYGEPDAEVLSDNQAIQGAVTRGIIDLLARSANSQRGLAKGMLDPLNRRRYEQGQDYEFNPQSNPMSGGVVEHKYPEIPQSALTVLAMQGQDAESLTGVKSFSGGISGSSYGDVAAGVRGALDAASKREMAILRRLAQGIIAIGNKIIAMNADFLSDVEVIRITNSDFVTVNREDLAGNFDLDTDISTAEVDNNKVQDLAFMLQTLGNTMDSGITMLILSEIAELKRMPELANKIKTFKPEPDPMQEKLKELEIAKLELELAEIQSSIAVNNAKAKQLSSNADKTDLDYVEQETGTKHARDMDKQQAQARANQDLQVTKALTAPKKPDMKDPAIEEAIGFNIMSDRDQL